MAGHTEDEKRRDEVLKRMLATPPKPHDDSKKPSVNVKKNKFVEEGSVDIDHLSTVEKKEGGGVPGKFSRPKPAR